MRTNLEEWVILQNPLVFLPSLTLWHLDIAGKKVTQSQIDTKI